MKTIEQHNKEVRDELDKPYPRQTGIQCPLCKAELLSVSDTVLLSYPAQKRVKCERCVWNGTVECHTSSFNL